MGGLISSLNIGSSGLFMNQKGIEVTGNNVSNANTDGYSRQSLQLSSLPTLEFNGNLIGQGVSVSGIERAEDVFVTSQLIQKSATYGSEDAQSFPLSQVESVVSIGEDSLASDLDAFFTAWQELSDNPSGATERQSVLQAGEEVASSLQSMDEQLTTVQQGINETLLSQVDNLNQQLQQVSDLNVQIVAEEAGGQSANALRDQRDLLLQEISQTVGVTYYETDNGMVSLQLPNGLPLVEGDSASSFTTTSSGGDVLLSLEMGGSEIALDSDDLGGAWQGMLQVRDEFIPSVRDDLDRLAYEFATAVNGVQNGGIDQDGASGADFFSVTTSADPTADAWTGAAGTIALALTETSQIAAGTTGQSGDNSNALAMLDLQDQELIDGSTFSEFYSKLAGTVGNEVDRNETALNSAEDALEQVQNLRDSVAGVSVDEEMLMLLQYQNGFEAASRYISAVQDMMDVLMNI